MRLIDADRLLDDLRGNVLVDVTPEMEKAIQECRTENEKVMRAYFKVENWLYGDGKEKPVEIQSAMLWGALMVAHNHGDIDWDEMRNLYGEFMSKKMDLR